MQQIAGGGSEMSERSDEISVGPTLLFGLLLPCFFVLVPIIALMVYGIALASFQLCAKA